MSMNAFRLAGDWSHVLGILVLLYQLTFVGKARGISLRTQEIFLLVFVTRYLDLFTSFYSVYNSVMKVLFILSTALIVALLRYGRPNETYDQARDSLNHWKRLVLPCAILGTLIHLIGSGAGGYDLMEHLWTFSICLESVAIVPQLSLLQQCRQVENAVANAFFFLGAYRALYIANWVYRAHYEPNYRHHWVVYYCGVLQTFLYMDLFISYYKSKCCQRREGTTDEEEPQQPVFTYEPLLFAQFHRPSEEEESDSDEAGFLLMEGSQEDEDTAKPVDGIIAEETGSNTQKEGTTEENAQAIQVV